jgi:hypothetical protein
MRKKLWFKQAIIMEMLKKFTLAELRQLAVYMSEFQECAFITPENVHQKKCWLNTTNQMIIRKAPVNPEEYITRLRLIVRWFIDHKINLRIGMKNGGAFYDKITNNFVRNISATVIHLEDRQRNFIDINKNDLVLPTDIENRLYYDPNNMDRWYFYDDDDRTPVRRIPSPPVVRNIIIPRRLLFDEDVEDQTHSFFSTEQIPDEEVTDETRALECKVCMTNKICVLLVKCGHTFCHSCTTRIDNRCATCRAPFTNFSKARMYI